MISGEFIKQSLAHQEESSNEDEMESYWTDSPLIDLSITDGGDAELWQFVLNTYQKEMSDRTLSILAVGPR